MVHKKSEYRLQFHSLSQDLRKQIWQENIRFREFRRSVNQAHHYWTYQITDEPCVCDDDLDKVNRCGVFAAPVLDSLEKSDGVQGYVQEPCLSSKKPRSGSLRQVRLKEPEVDETFGQEVAVQTPEWNQEQHVPSNGRSPELHHMMQHLSTTEREDGSIKQNSALNEFPLETAQGKSSSEPEGKTTSIPSAPKQESPLGNMNRSHISKSPEIFGKRDLPSRFSSLSKTSRKYFFEDKKMPFASYGWNDSDKNVGEKKTYNVNAPETEVHSPALMAQKRRREDIERYLKREADLYSQSQLSKSPVNLSSIWMSEYQDKFSRGASSLHSGRFNRPLSASFYSPLCWKYR